MSIPVTTKILTLSPQRTSIPFLNADQLSIGNVIVNKTASDINNLATTSYVSTSLSSYALLNSPSLTGVPLSVTPITTNNTTQIATTNFVQSNLANHAPIYNPTLTGSPKSVNQGITDNSTNIATTAFVKSILFQPFFISHTVPDGTNVDLTTANTWTQYPLTSISNIPPGANLANNIITLPVGTYSVDGWTRYIYWDKLFSN
jgi:hypothetical protein